MYALYIGEKTEWIEQLQKLLNQKMTVANTLLLARSYIFENFYTSKQPIFVFIESTDATQNIKRITQLKKNRIKNQYLILIGSNIPKEVLYGYIDCGINDVIDISISKESLHQLLLLLPRLKKTKDDQETIHLFHLPLWKRLFDIFFASGALLCLSPLFLITALAIRLESKGPVIYASQRVGCNYNIFGFLKFRSMYADADKRLDEFKKLNQYQTETNVTEKPKYYSEQSNDSGTIFVGDDFRLTEKEYLTRRQKLKENSFIKLQNDPRITKVGYFIRKYSIDELPQLFNILQGDMSIVGNRPLPLYEAETLTSDDYIERFMAPAGLTGLWQVEKRGMEGILSAEERKQLDIQYARKFSFKLDVRIILRTFTTFIQKENV